VVIDLPEDADIEVTPFSRLATLGLLDELYAMAASGMWNSPASVTAFSGLGAGQTIFRLDDWRNYSSAPIQAMTLEWFDLNTNIYATGGGGACYFDAGGPAFLSIDGEDVLVGVAARLTDYVAPTPATFAWIPPGRRHSCDISSLCLDLGWVFMHFLKLQWRLLCVSFSFYRRPGAPGDLPGFPGRAGFRHYSSNAGHGEPIPSVGVLKIVYEDGTEELWCSGTLISPTAFLTTGWCMMYISLHPTWKGYISLDNNIFDEEDDNWIEVKNFVIHYTTLNSGNGNGGFHWYSVVTLPKSLPAGHPPAILTPPGFLDERSAKGGLRGLEFISVGYGYQADWEQGRFMAGWMAGETMLQLLSWR